METITINLTIGKETREVEARVSKRPFHTMLHVSRLKMSTTHGGKVHQGWAEFLYKEGSNDYNINEACDVRYSGMRGNGNARPSTFRYIGF